MCSKWEVHLNNLKSILLKFLILYSLWLIIWTCESILCWCRNGTQLYIWQCTHLARLFVRHRLPLCFEPRRSNTFHYYMSLLNCIGTINSRTLTHTYAFVQVPTQGNGRGDGQTSKKQRGNGNGWAAAWAEPQGEGQSETNEMGRAKCEPKHQQDVEQGASKRRVGVLSSGGSNPDWHCVNYSN